MISLPWDTWIKPQQTWPCTAPPSLHESLQHHSILHYLDISSWNLVEYCQTLPGNNSLVLYILSETWRGFRSLLPNTQVSLGNIFCSSDKTNISCKFYALLYSSLEQENTLLAEPTVALMLCTNSPWLIYSWLEPCTFHLAKHPMLDPHVFFNAQHLFPFLRISLLSSYQAAKTQSNTLCSSFITCSISSDFTGGLEYWPERRPCPNLALWGRKWQGGNKCEKNRKA